MNSMNDVCDLDLIYNEKFKYSIPRNVLTTFLEGNAFGRDVKYSPNEQDRLHRDINLLYAKIMSESPTKGNTAVITAGAPGAGKTILLKSLFESETLEGRHFAYDDPDDVCLKGMENTYLSELNVRLNELSNAEGEGRLSKEKEIRLEMYNKWRAGSNAAAHIILANLIRDNYSFYFGSTSSSPMTALSFDYLTNRGYSIHLIHISAEDSVRWASVRERDKDFVQTTEEDIVDKGRMVPERINDTYLKFADRIDFYYRPSLESDAQIAAVWIRDKTTSDSFGDLIIKNEDAYETLVKLHDKISETLQNSELLFWKNSVGTASK